jgi:hypothetical protein
MNKITTVWQYIRVKFKPGTDKKGRRQKFSRPQRIFEITCTQEQENKEIKTWKEYAPTGVKGTAKRITSSDFVTEWERSGPTPTPRPLRKYDDMTLKKMGHSIEQIKVIRGRNFSAKDVKIITHKIGCSNTEAKELLKKYNGNRHAIYEEKGAVVNGNETKKKTIGRKIDGKWISNVPGEKTEKVKTNMEHHRRRIQSLKTRCKKRQSKSKHKLKRRRGF